MSSRRRRKSKSQKSQKRSSSRWLAWAGLAVFVIVMGGVVYGYNAVRSYLRSDDFRTMLGDQAGEFLKGGAEIDPFKWDGWNVSTERFVFQGEEEFQNIEVRGIDASVDIGGIWDGAYRIKDVRVREIGFIKDFNQEGIGIRKPLKEKKETFWDRFLPDKIEVTSVNVAEFHGGIVSGEEEWAWNDVTAEVKPGANEGVFEIALQGGQVTTPLKNLSQLDLERAKGRFSGDRFFLLASDFTAFRNGRIRMDGDFGIESGRWELNGEVRGVQMEEVIAEDWKRRLMGPLLVDFRVEQEPGQEILVKGNLEMPRGELTALPVLDRIAAYANTERFRRLLLSEASLEFTRRGETLDLRNIKIASEGLIRVEGRMTITGNDITFGEFRVGITPGTLAHLPGAETKVFRPGELGLLWSPMMISGTLDAPQEDLSDRLIAAAKERMFEMLPETGQWALKYSGKAIGDSTKAVLEQKGIVLDAGKGLLDRTGNLLRQGADSALETGKGVIESGKGALETGKGAVEGVGNLFNIFGSPDEKED